MLVRQATAEEAEKEAKGDQDQTRNEIARIGRQTLIDMAYGMSHQISDSAPTAQVEIDDDPIKTPPEGCRLWGELRAGLANGELRMQFPDPRMTIAEAAFPQSGWDVVLGGMILVRQKDRAPLEQSSSLWYASIDGSEYRWWEVSYSATPFNRQSPPLPFSLVGSVEAADNAALCHVAGAAIIGNGPFGIAYGPQPVDGEEQEAFMDHWLGLFVQAVKGKLR